MPGLLIGSLIIFVALLALIVVLLLRLWRDEEAIPLLRGGAEIGLAPGQAIDAGGVGAGSVAVAKVAGGNGASAAGSSAQADGAPDVGISAGLPVAGPAPAEGEAPATPGPGSTPVQPAPPAAQAPASEPTPAEAAPVVAEVPGSTGPRGGPGASVPPRTAVTGPGVSAASFEIHDGGEYELAFEFMLENMEYAEPGVENLLLRFGGDEAEPPVLGLQLWEMGDGEWYSGVARGIWTSGEAAGGARFLTPVSEGAWHRLVVDFAASSRGEGGYGLFLDGQLIDARPDVSLIAPDRTTGTVELGLFREGQRLEAGSELRVAEASLSETSPAATP